MVHASRLGLSKQTNDHQPLKVTLIADAPFMIKANDSNNTTTETFTDFFFIIQLQGRKTQIGF